MSDRHETGDMTAATCSKPSPNPAAGRGCIDSSEAIDEDIDTDDQPQRRRQYLYPSSIRAVGDQLGRLMVPILSYLFYFILS